MEWGSWLMFNHYLTITRWVPDFNPFGTEINKIAAWVRLPNIPIEYYDKRFLGTVGDHIEKTLKVDMNTANQLRGNFVCQCVELDLSRPLNAKYMGLLQPWRVKEKETSNNGVTRAREVEETRVKKSCLPNKSLVNGWWFKNKGSKKKSTVKDTTEKEDNGAKRKADKIMAKNVAESTRYEPLSFPFHKNNSPHESMEETKTPQPNMDVVMETEPSDPGELIFLDMRLMTFLHKEQLWWQPGETRKSLEGKTFTWTDQGAASPKFANIIREYYRQYNPHVVAIQETRCSGQVVDKSIRNYGFQFSLSIDANGFWERIWLLWNNANLRIQEIGIHDQALHISIENGRDRWLLTVVYSHPPIWPKQGGPETEWKCVNL
ncbi:Transposon TX1 uncharacterized [Arachis hypogaea]|nr:Transposon TX1 uncharacterized [Arachis hypogaea]